MLLFFTHCHAQFLQIFFDFKRRRKYPLLGVANAAMFVAHSSCKTEGCS